MPVVLTDVIRTGAKNVIHSTELKILVEQEQGGKKVIALSILPQ